MLVVSEPGYNGAQKRVSLASSGGALDDSYLFFLIQSIVKSVGNRQLQRIGFFWKVLLELFWRHLR
jgi:hypothetical protein